MSKNEHQTAAIGVMRSKRDLSIEELDEILKRNKKQNTTEDNNTSFHSYRNNNFSFDKGNKIESQKTERTGIKRNLNDKDNSMVSMEPLSDGEEKCFKFRGNNISNITTVLNKQDNAPSDSAYVKTLLEKIRLLSIENEEAKKSFVEVSELLEKERSDFQNKLIKEVNKGLESERSFKNDMEELINDNKVLQDNYNELKAKLALMNTNLNILETEKGRHLERNALDKRNLEEEIQNLIRASDEDKRRLINLTNENNVIKQQLTKVVLVLTT
jgi:hypothetical protein